ncbi:PREDICTED: IST1 homolog [Tarenaya hassleriana]|uniref:IST1 homolog n=1 Tax=Tarenaya hassleriana TaxID=28532 RepID=UPI00053C7B06|nr:PREDICTED: IST1 homolog [Tarenaya hassleriana]
MSMLDSFFNKGFKAAKCKTLLKLTTPRIKLLRNRREVQIKQMRREIAKLLETGQEATARIRVEHIVREEKMMAAQEIIELFCELMAVRLPIIESQRECPLDLKEAISSVCFAAPRCADLPELQQVQMLFVSKYGKEFVAAATELRPDCGVNRKLVELLSVCAPSPETKLKLLKDIAEEHELDWNPSATETEFFKSHDDLLDGPKQFGGGSTLPLPKEEHDEGSYSAQFAAQKEKSDSDSDLDTLEFPEVPNVVLRPNPGAAPIAQSAVSRSPENVQESAKHADGDEHTSEDLPFESEITAEAKSNSSRDESPKKSSKKMPEEQQFSPFVSPPSHVPESDPVKWSDYSAPSLGSETFSAKESLSPPDVPRTKPDMDLQDVLAAAQIAAETAERAAAAARSAASLAQLRIAELTKNTDHSTEKNQFQGDKTPETPSCGKPHLDHQNSSTSSSGDFPQLPQRLPSMEDDPYFSYPNLFTSQNSGRSSDSRSPRDS